MANLLSPIQRGQIKTEYYLRLANTVIFLVSLCVLAAIVLLTPAYLNARSELRSIDYEIEAIKQAGNSVIDPQNQVVASTLKSRLKFVNQQGSSLMEEYIHYVAVMSALPKQLTYSRISFLPVTPDSESGPSIPTEENPDAIEETITPPAENIVTVSGTAATRTDLADAIRSVSELSWVKDIDYPLSDLSKSVEIDFSFKIIYQKDLIPEIKKFASYLIPADKSLPSTQNRPSDSQVSKIEPESALERRVDPDLPTTIDTSDNSAGDTL